MRCARPRADRRRRRLRGAQSGRRATPFAARPHLARLTRSAHGLGLPEPDHDEVRRGMAAVAGGRAAAPRPGADHVDRRTARRSARDRGDGPPSLVVVAAPMDPGPTPRPWPRCPGRATSAGRSPASRPRRTARTCAPSPRPRARAPARRSSPTSRATSAKAPAPTSSTSSTASCARPTLASGCLAGITRGLILDWYGATRGRRADRGGGRAGQRDLPGLHDPRRAGHPRAGTTATCDAPGPVTTEVRKVGTSARPSCSS